jgi:hypothetical protein
MAALAQQKTNFDYFAGPRQRNQQVLTISPQSYFYDPHDFSTDSAPSPDSPLSLVFTNPYQLPSADDDWLLWDDKPLTQDISPKVEPFDSPVLASDLPRYVSVSPAINPLELAGSMMDVEVPFGGGSREGNAMGGMGLGMSDSQILFPASRQAQKAQTMQQMQQQMKYRQQAQQATAADYPQPRESRESQSRARKSTGTKTLPSPQTYSRKRKSSYETSSHSSRSSASASPPPPSRRSTAPTTSSAPKKTTHNVIEKRYRTNLNDKIAALRDSVPSLRVMARRLEPGHGSDDEMGPEGCDDDCDEELGGLTPAHKLNKATVLSKATEYITHLEKKNKTLARENAELRDRVEGFETMIMSRGRPSDEWS